MNSEKMKLSTPKGPSYVGDLRADELKKKSVANPLLITVVTVVYNCVNSLEETLLSIIGQTYENIEYIVIDGDSTDGTVDIIKKYNDKIKYWISEPDEGIYDAMNKALRVATGDFLIFMNAGDRFYSDQILDEFLRYLPDKEKVYYGNANYINSISGEEYSRGGRFTKYRLSKTNICHQTIFYSRKAYQSNAYNLKYPIFSDWVYNIRLFKQYNYTYLDQTIANYDTHGISAGSRDICFEEDQKKLLIRYLGFDTIVYIFCKKIKDLIVLNQ